MNTIQLTVDMTDNKNIKKYFRGVFPSDKLPKKIKKPSLLIVNTDPSTSKGSHWVAFYIPRTGKPEYFDSLGRIPEKKEFLEFLAKHGKTFDYNKKRLQGTFSTTCGNYCGVYLYFRSKNIPFKQFLKLFSSKNFELNDSKILELYKKIFRRKKKVQIGGSQIICNQTCQPIGI